LIRYNREWRGIKADKLSAAPPVLLVAPRIFFISSHRPSDARQR